MHDMKILITGVSGFVGRYLAQVLSKEYALSGVMRSPAIIADIPVNHVVANLSDHHFTEKLPENIDCVIHLAQSASYRNFPDGADDMRLINIDATAKLLEWARITGVKHFIYTSTANVYEKSNNRLTEDCPTNPSSFYGASKRAAEYLILQYHEYFQIQIIRCFTIYGPGQQGMLIPNIIERIKSGAPIILAGGVGIHLTPIYITDLCTIIKRFIMSPPSQEKQLINICGNELVSLSEIIKIAENIIGNPAIIQNTNDDAAYFIGCSQRLMDYLGEYSFLDIKTGLQRVIMNSSMAD